MPPKIMFRVFFGRIEDAQNDNAAGPAYGAMQDATQEEMPLPPFLGSRLADAMAHGSAKRMSTRLADGLDARLAAVRRLRLQVIEEGEGPGDATRGDATRGDATRGDAQPGAAQKRPAPEGRPV